MIELKAVDRRHDSGVLALEGLNLSIAPGEFVCVLGPKGCGKSTLLRVLAGIDRATAGEVLRRGEPARGTMADASFVFSTPALMPWANVATNVELPLRQLGEADPVVRERHARAALGSVGLGDAADKMPRELDEASRMRAALARALVIDPSLLLLDDWLAAQDDAARQLLLQVLAERARIDKGRAVVMTTRSVEDAVLMADRVIVLSSRPGRIVEDLRVAGRAKRDASFVGGKAFATACERIHRALAEASVELAA